MDCGVANLVVLEFDHVRDKRWNITHMVGAGFPWSTIEAEIAKVSGSLRELPWDQDRSRTRLLRPEGQGSTLRGLPRISRPA
jgi:hypothetical protein